MERVHPTHPRDSRLALAAAIRRAAAAVRRWRDEVAAYPSDADRWLR